MWESENSSKRILVEEMWQPGNGSGLIPVYELWESGNGSGSGSLNVSSTPSCFVQLHAEWIEKVFGQCVDTPLRCVALVSHPLRFGFLHKRRKFISVIQ